MMNEEQAKQLIRDERLRQIGSEGITLVQDDQYVAHQLYYAALSYYVSATSGNHRQHDLWPWDSCWWKPKSRLRDLVRAGALLLAEGERVSRIAGNSFRCTDCILLYDKILLAMLECNEEKSDGKSGGIAMRLHCPECGGLHIDEGQWAHRPHHTHACQHCGEVWRPAVVNTVGVRFLPGFKNGQ